jgi:hypothetical protein
MKLKFAAIGSNVLVAEEIKRAVQSIFYKDIDIESYTLDMLPAKKWRISTFVQRLNSKNYVSSFLQ